LLGVVFKDNDCIPCKTHNSTLCCVNDHSLIIGWYLLFSIPYAQYGVIFTYLAKTNQYADQGWFMLRLDLIDG